MINTTYKKYTIQAKRCIKGESFFESIISEYAIPHHIVGQKDIGTDYFCEWVFGDRPTGVIFTVQIKTFSHDTAIPKFIGKSNQNQLQEYKILNSNLKIDLDTLYYWQGLGIPIYLFAIFEDAEGKLHCFYKRYTSILTRDSISLSDFKYTDKFYSVSKNDTFLAFANKNERTNGFARDLFIDHIRWNYFKGSIAYLNPHSIGLNQYPEDNIFPELAIEYKNKIDLTYSKWRRYLGMIKDPATNDNFGSFSTAATASYINGKIKKL